MKTKNILYLLLIASITALPQRKPDCFNKLLKKNRTNLMLCDQEPTSLWLMTTWGDVLILDDGIEIHSRGVRFNCLTKDGSDCVYKTQVDKDQCLSRGLCNIPGCLCHHQYVQHFTRVHDCELEIRHYKVLEYCHHWEIKHKKKVHIQEFPSRMEISGANKVIACHDKCIERFGGKVVVDLSKLPIQEGEFIHLVVESEDTRFIADLTPVLRSTPDDTHTYNALLVVISILITAIVVLSSVIVVKCRKLRSSSLPESPSESLDMPPPPPPLPTITGKRSKQAEPPTRVLRSSASMVNSLGLILLILGCVNGLTCAPGSVLHPKSVTCKDGACTSSHGSLIDLPNPGETICLIQAGDVTSHITITVKAIEDICEMDILFYTRPVKQQVLSNWHCPGVFPCTGTLCDEHKGPIMEAKTKHYRGVTSCKMLPACWGMGCFACSYSCLFYRQYLVPVGKPGKVTHCRRVVPRVMLTMLKEGSLKSFYLTPFKSVTVLGSTFRLTGGDISPELSHHYFFQSNSKACLISSPGKRVDIGSLIPVKCSAWNDTVDLRKCDWSPGSCRSSGSKVTCDAGGVTEDELCRSELPLILPNFNMSFDGSHIVIKKELGKNPQLKVGSMMEIASNQTRANCSVGAISSSGCIACDEGITLRLNVTHISGDGHLLIKCGSSMGLIECKKLSRIDTIKIFADSSIFTIVCSTMYQSFNVSGVASSGFFTGKVDITSSELSIGSLNIPNWRWGWSWTTIALVMLGLVVVVFCLCRR